MKKILLTSLQLHKAKLAVAKLEAHLKDLEWQRRVECMTKYIPMERDFMGTTVADDLGIKIYE